jgi:hypothetical protein
MDLANFEKIIPGFFGLPALHDTGEILSVPTNVTDICSSVSETEEPKLRLSIWPGHRQRYRGPMPMWHCRVCLSVTSRNPDEYMWFIFVVTWVDQ